MTEHSSSVSAAPSWGLALVSMLHALTFATVAWIVPATAGSWFALTLWPLALLHLALFGLALGRRVSLRLRVWTALSLYSLAWLGLLTWITVTSALYIAAIYGRVGEAVAGGLACVLAVVVLFTLPIAAWGLASARPAWLARRTTAVALFALALAGALAAGALRAQGQLQAVRGAAESDLERLLTSIAHEHAGTPPGEPPRSVLQRTPTSCAAPVAHGVSLLVSTLDRAEQPLSACLQASSVHALSAQLSKLVREQTLPEAPIKLDWIRATHTIVRVHPLLDALALRPALDGVCSEGRCFAPWQLVALDAFTTNHPIPSVRDASFGVSFSRLTDSLGVLPSAQLTRFETTSWIADRHALWPLIRGRGRARAEALDDAALDRAIQAAGAHVIAAASADGTFRYTLNPFTGDSVVRTVSIRRHAGTVFALCELLPAATSAEPAKRALALLRTFERQHGALRMLSERDDLAELGPSALPLIALVACRPAVGPMYDDLIAGITRFLLALQRADGSFYPELDLATGKPRGTGESMYAGGQAMLGLVLAEQLVAAEPSKAWPDQVRLRDGIERAMRYYGNQYWPRPLRTLFFLEENWHCLAARAALTSHRNDDYERFCLDYARFKTRLILNANASPEHVGAYSISDIFPPHAGVTAGFGEVMSAALAIEHARGMDLRQDQAILRNVLGWLIQQQWTAQTCFACGANGAAIGGFSEHAASPVIRIDYVQHAMAALGHGKRALALR